MSYSWQVNRHVSENLATSKNQKMIIRKFKFNMIRIFLGIVLVLQFSCNCNHNSKKEKADYSNIEFENINLLTQQKPQEDYAQALLSSKPDFLTVDSNGCIRIREYLIIWPYGFKIVKEEKELTILDYNGNFVVNIGDEIQVSGGECAKCTLEDIEKIVRHKPKDNCFGKYWIVGEEIRVR